MEMRSDPKSHTWTSSAVGKIITTTYNMIECRAGGNFQALIHEELLCYFSPYYTAAFKGGFSEANQGSTSFELTELQAKLLVTWLYSGRIEDDINYSDVLDLYIFADMTDITALRRDIMDHLFKRGLKWQVFDEESVPEHFKTLPPSSGLVRWMVDNFAQCWARLFGSYDSYLKPRIAAFEIPGEFFDQVRAAYCRDWTEVSECHFKTPCHYHEHETVEEWRSKFVVGVPEYERSPNNVFLSECAGESFEMADKAYLGGTTAAGPPIKDRYVVYDYCKNFEGNWQKIWMTGNKTICEETDTESGY
ncbi:unnamed protein product [Aureobasidium pullulans]|nr:unnamed protein product [Aureobasidium pullulans]